MYYNQGQPRYGFYHEADNILVAADEFGAFRTMFRPNPAIHGLATNWDYIMSFKPIWIT
jgi:hypothetical protein